MKLVKWKVPFLAMLLSFVKSSFAGEEFAHTINGNIICNDVIKEDGIIIDDSGSFQDEDTNFACIVDPVYAVSESKYIELILLNLPPSFENDRKAALKSGKTRLLIVDGTVEKSTLILPDNNNIAYSPADIFTNEEEPHPQQCYSSKIVWLSPQGKEETSPHHHSRKLAVNQTGKRNILVFRITTVTHGSPNTPAARASFEIFGTPDNNSSVNLVSQFAACSDNKLVFEPAEITPPQFSPATLSATGVFDISVHNTSSSSTANDIKNSVIALVGDNFLNQADHVFYMMVSISEVLLVGIFEFLKLNTFSYSHIFIALWNARPKRRDRLDGICFEGEY